MVRKKEGSKKRAQIKKDPEIIFYFFKCRKCGQSFRSKDKNPVCSVCGSTEMYKKEYNPAI